MHCITSGQAMYVFRTQGKQAIYYTYNEFNISKMGKYISIFLLSTDVSVQYQMCVYMDVMKKGNETDMFLTKFRETADLDTQPSFL